MDKESLDHLLRGGHFDVPERIARGIWPHPPLQFESLVDHLAAIIQTEKWFPCERSPHKDGEPVAEWGFIENIAPNRFLYHTQRAYAHDHTRVAESVSIPFKDARTVARHYLQWTLHLPGDLDSWKVV